MQTVFDTENDHYQIVSVGWDEKRRIHGCSIHLDLKDGKIWIQVNTTEIDIGQDLVNLGIRDVLPTPFAPVCRRHMQAYGVGFSSLSTFAFYTKEDIVIGFQPPSLRYISGYAAV